MTDAERRFTVERGNLAQTHLTHNRAVMEPLGEIMPRAHAGAEYRS